MFCCTYRQSHEGELITGICMQQQCINEKRQLLCAICLKQEHEGHKVNTLKKMIPQLLGVNRRKQKHLHLLQELAQFVNKLFNIEQSQQLNESNVVHKVKEILTFLKSQNDHQQSEIIKVQSIFQNIRPENIYNSQIITKSKIQKPVTTLNFKNQQFSNEGQMTNNLQTQSHIILKNHQNQNKKFIKNEQKIGQIYSQSPSKQDKLLSQFSIFDKHSYLSTSNNGNSLMKITSSGYRFSGLSSGVFSVKKECVQVHIDCSNSGNIMLGFCHPSIVKQREYTNCYGTNEGTYLIGQNNRNSETAISFHHYIGIFNRKEIVGWGFDQGDDLIVGFDFKQEYMYFKKIIKKSQQPLQFIMKLTDSQNPAKCAAIQSIIKYEGLKLIVMLEQLGDKVTLYDI